MIFIIVCVSWNNKLCFDIIDARCKHEAIVCLRHQELLNYRTDIFKIDFFFWKSRVLSLLEISFFICSLSKNVEKRLMLKIDREYLL
jgi:hypothetical protein